MKHTIGPWKYDGGNIIRDAKGFGVVELFTQHDGAEQDANAALVAAAPEMIEALEAVFNSADIYYACGNVYPPKIEALMILLGKVIARARGEA